MKKSYLLITESEKKRILSMHNKHFNIISEEEEQNDEVTIETSSLNNMVKSLNNIVDSIPELKNNNNMKSKFSVRTEPIDEFSNKCSMGGYFYVTNPILVLTRNEKDCTKRLFQVKTDTKENNYPNGSLANLEKQLLKNLSSYKEKNQSDIKKNISRMINIMRQIAGELISLSSKIPQNVSVALYTVNGEVGLQYKK